VPVTRISQRTPRTPKKESVGMNLSNEIRIIFGTNSIEPNKDQLRYIFQDVRKQNEQGSIKSLHDFGQIVKKYCPSAGTCVYKGLDNSDLNTLIALAIQETQRS